MKTEENDSAFAYVVEGKSYDDRYVSEGLTKREYFAAMAMQGLMASGIFTDKQIQNQAVASVNVADALIKELNKEA